MSHTKEKVCFGEDNDGWYLGIGNEQLAWCLTEDHARRFSACVNACAGLDTEWLESMAKAGGFGAMNQYIAAYNQAAAAIVLEKKCAAMTAEAARLRDALESLLTRAAPEWETESGIAEYAEACNNARSLIAGGKGGAA